MARLIDADALIESIKHGLWDWETIDGIESRTVLEQTIQDIRNEPTIDAEPVRHGKWLFEEYPDGYYHSQCSLCNSWFSEDAFLNPYKYCPNCGACMIKQGDITTEQGDITTKRIDIPTMDEVNDGNDKNET